MRYLLNADIAGQEVVQHLITAGLVKDLTCQTFDDFDKWCIWLMPKLVPGDEIIIDTISALANQTRGDHKLGTDMMASVWDRSEVFFRDKYGQLGYEAAQQQIMRRIRNFVAIGKNMADAGKEPCRVYIASHQREQVDPMTGVKGAYGPDLNSQFFSALYSTATDLFRLDVVLDDELDDAGRVRIAADTRILYLRRTADQIAKNRCRTEISKSLPRGIKDPTIPKLFERLDRKPGCLVIYAPGGAGKTTFLCSGAQAEYEAELAAKTTQQNDKEESNAA